MGLTYNGYKWKGPFDMSVERPLIFYSCKLNHLKIQDSFQIFMVIVFLFNHIPHPFVIPIQLYFSVKAAINIDGVTPVVRLHNLVIECFPGLLKRFIERIEINGPEGMG